MHIVGVFGLDWPWKAIFHLLCSRISLCDFISKAFEAAEAGVEKDLSLSSIQKVSMFVVAVYVT